MKKSMPIGIDDFKEVRNFFYFVDKTKFIKQLIDDHSRVTLLTRPRRFGKTLTMSMLQYFFTMEDAQENQKLFRGLSIEAAGGSYMGEQGKYPVVFVTLKGCKRLTWEETYDSLKRKIAELFDHFHYLRDSDQLTDMEKNYVADILAHRGNSDLYYQSLQLLTRLLFKHHGVKPILLIDEYDVPIQSGWENGFYNQATTFFKGWMSEGLKTNTALKFAVLTGVLRIAKESIFSDLNNLDVCSVMTKKYNDLLGFTPQEIAQLTRDLAVEEKLPELKKWYNGYSFAGQEMYNPWSVLKYIDAQCTPQPYWVNTSGNGIIRLLLETMSDQRVENLKMLFEDQTVESEIDEGVIYADIDKDENALYTMLLTTGYLTLKKEEKIDELTTFYYLGIPNMEIKGIYKREILARVGVSVATQDLNGLFRSLLHGEAKQFEEHLQRMLLQMVSYYDTNHKENFYHGFLLGLTALLTSAYHIESNRESGYGRFDIALFPNRRNQLGVIMEFKVTDASAKLEIAAQEALRQIDEKMYEAEFTKREIKNVLKYGIAFSGKKVKIVCGP